MRGWMLLVYCLLAVGLGLPAGYADVPLSGIVTRVLDGDTFVLQNGERIRLLDINTPELAHDGEPEQPLATAARLALTNMISGTYVTLETGTKPFDPYGRVLAHVYTETGGWVNGGIVAAGLAHVYTFADNALYAAPLKRLEAAARDHKAGIWRLPQWQLRPASTCCDTSDIGQFILVEGAVVSAVTLGLPGPDQRTYINFGTDYRTDFSIEIRGRDMRAFRQAGIDDIPAFYTGKTLLVRGLATPVNGVQMMVTHPDQIDIVRN